MKIPQLAINECEDRVKAVLEKCQALGAMLNGEPARIEPAQTRIATMVRVTSATNSAVFPLSLAERKAPIFYTRGTRNLACLLR